MNAFASPFPSTDFLSSTAMSNFREWLPFPVLMNATASEVAFSKLPQLPPLPVASSPRETAPTSWVIPAMPAAGEPTERVAPISSARRARATGDYNDEDLAAALCPVVEQSVQQVFQQPGAMMESYWEPWLRTLIRRTFAEQRSLYEPIDEPGWLSRLNWSVGAFFGGRSYREVLWEKTGRFRMEEVYLLRANDGKCLAHVAGDAQREGGMRRAMEMARLLADSRFDAEGALRSRFRLPQGLRAELRAGRFCDLVAVVSGNFPESLLVDLDFLLRRIESRYGKELVEQEDVDLTGLRPLLVDCLLINAPSFS